MKLIYIECIASLHAAYSESMLFEDFMKQEKRINHRILGLFKLKSIFSCGPILCLSRVTQSNLWRTVSRKVLNIFKDGVHHNLSGQPVPMLHHLCSKEVLPDLQMALHLKLVSIAARYWALLRRALCHLMFPPIKCLYILIRIIPFSPLSSRQKSPSSASIFSHERCPSSLIIISALQ